MRFFKKKHRIFTIQQQLIKTLNIFTRIYLPPYSLNHLRISYCLRSGLSEEISKAIITSLSAKEPILLIGEHGTGLTDKSLLDLIAETDTDLTRWKTEKHFTSWLCLTPWKHQSGKKNKSRNKKGYTKAGQVFRNAACALTKSNKTAQGAFYNRVKSRKGPLIAIKATARKIAVLYYNVMTKGIDYVEKGILDYQQKVKEQKMKYLKKLYNLVTHFSQ